jgi:uncharacterized membrane protein
LSGEVIAFASALLWAVSSVLLTVGARQIDVLPLNFLRTVVSTLFFWALLPFFGGLEAVAAIPAANWLWLLLSVLMLLVVGDTFYFLSMELAGVSWAMPVASINPLWAVLLAFLWLDEPLTWTLLAGALLVVLGIVLVSRMSGRPVAKSVDSQLRRKGLILALLVSVLWAVGQVALKPGTEGVNSVVANSVRQPMGMLALLALTLARGRWGELKKLDTRSWAVIGVASLLGTGIGSLLFVISIQMIGAGRAAVLTSTSPLMAIPFSMLWLQERPTRWTVAGTVLNTAGIALVA